MSRLSKHPTAAVKQQNFWTRGGKQCESPNARKSAGLCYAGHHVWPSSKHMSLVDMCELPHLLWWGGDPSCLCLKKQRQWICCGNTPHLRLHSTVPFMLLLLLLQLLELLLKCWQLHQLAVHDLHLFLQLMGNSCQLVTRGHSSIQGLPVDTQGIKDT